LGFRIADFSGDCSASLGLWPALRGKKFSGAEGLIRDSELLLDEKWDIAEMYYEN
jgi:hypothetical protein